MKSPNTYHYNLAIENFQINLINELPKIDSEWSLNYYCQNVKYTNTPVQEALK